VLLQPPVVALSFLVESSTTEIYADEAACGFFLSRCDHSGA
jgi:hypothetical protein